MFASPDFHLIMKMVSYPLQCDECKISIEFKNLCWFAGKVLVVFGADIETKLSPRAASECCVHVYNPLAFPLPSLPPCQDFDLGSGAACGPLPAGL